MNAQAAVPAHAKKLGSNPARIRAVAPPDRRALSPLQELRRALGNREFGRFVQAKLAMGLPNDRFEQEADRVADQVMRMPPAGIAIGSLPLSAHAAPIVQRTCAACGDHGGGLCPECEKKRREKQASGEGLFESEEDSMLQAKAVSGPVQAAPQLEARVNTMRGGGQPLGTSLREFFEPRFGYDFSGVRLHTDTGASELAHDARALAFTAGRDVVFGPGQFSPDTEAGRRLLAHELAHVVQQGRAGSAPAAGHSLIQRQPEPQVHPTLPGASGRSISFEKVSVDVETAYRRAGLAAQANAVRRCREEGACDKVLTEKEAFQLYSSGRITAGLDAPPQGAGAPLIAGTTALAPALQGGTVAESAVAKTALERAAARWGTAAVLEGGEGAAAVAPEAAALGEGAAALAPEAAAGAAGATVALPVALGVYVVVAIGSLWDWGQFQAELQRLGYVILPSPLAVCIANCHQPAAPTFRPSPWPFKEPTPRPLWPGSLSDADRRAIEEWLRPEAATPTPAPSPPPVPSPVPAPQPGPRRNPDQTCATEMPSVPLCSALPDNYTFGSPAAALAAIRAGNKNYSSARLEKRVPTTSGPCVGQGTHIAVRSGGIYVASIVCCPCCQDGLGGPKLLTRCAILWH